jgi:competence protein ComEA
MWGRSELRSAAHERLERIQVQWAPVATPVVEPARLRFGPWNRASWRGLIALLIVVCLIAGWWWWSGRPTAVIEAPMVIAEGAAVAGIDPVLSETVVVHVVGAVRKPGLVELPTGSRVADAVDAAGGVRNDKALASVNLARTLVDGEQVILDPQGAASSGGSGAAGGLLSINQASASEFEALPGIGPVLAQRIVDWRTTNGSFRSIDDLGEVSGIGDSIMKQIRSLVRL